MKRLPTLLRLLLRGRRSFVVEGVRYRERTIEPLRRALAGRGLGSKDFDCLFPDAAPLRIRCTPRRQYADITGPQLLAPYTLADPIIRPGMRVLDIRCSTGFGAQHLARLVGPSGAIVALDPDHESIRYARRRYTPGNISFEIGSLDSIEGELDASFDAIVAANLFCTLDNAAAQTASLWRVLAPGGPLLLVQPLPAVARPDHEAQPDPDLPLRLTTAELRNILLDLAPPPGIEPAETIELAAIIARKPAPAPSDTPPHPLAPDQPYPPRQ